MDSGKARKLFESYAAAMAYVEVENQGGDLNIGSAFHVGEGVFVTARHVVEGNKIVEVGMTESIDIELAGSEAEDARSFVYSDGKKQPVHRVSNGVMKLEGGPYFHGDDRVDVAVFKVEEIDSHTPVVPLGGHLDDWLGRSDFVLTEAVVLGYPPIPMAKYPTLVGTRAEVSAQIDLYGTPHVHFVLSAMARGGFSGGVAFSEYGFALGMVTMSLLSGEQSVESGYMSAVTVEPIFECLGLHKLLPDCQAEGWDGLWGTTHLYFYDGSSYQEYPNGVTGGRVAAGVDILDDGKQFSLTIFCDDNADLLSGAMNSIMRELDEYTLDHSEIRPGMIRVEIRGANASAGERIKIAGHSVARVFAEYGYIPSR
ncbi:S1 family peptidase [Streptomyces microflavus]|uniref:S1 family peptidase n=1 Tax=Streptomyces microflavus TaxID=1919 RepID=UPI0036605D9D